MADKDLKQYADGWITERKHTDVPRFLRFCYIVIASCCVAYLVLNIYGDIGHSERGPLVREFVRATTTSAPFMYFVAALVAVFFILVIIFAFRKMHED